MRKQGLIFFLLLSFVSVAQHKPLQLISEMIDSINAIKTVRFNLKAIEKINNGYSTAASEIKLQVSPRNMYFINKQKKLEILFNEGQHGNKAIVKPHVFPFITMHLDPRSSIMRKNQHYTIGELGFDFIGKTVAMMLGKDKDNMSRNLNYLGKHERNGYLCHMVSYELKTFNYVEYVVRPKETISIIALKLNLHDYMLRSKNNLYNDFGFIKPGTKLQVPVFYCKKAILYMDEKTMLPVSISIYDETGLFESYDFSNIIVNKPIDQKEFTKGYKDYNF